MNGLNLSLKEVCFYDVLPTKGWAIPRPFTDASKLYLDGVLHWLGRVYMSDPP